jgi:excisionase family DNA binding protein
VPEEFYTVEQVAERLGLHVKTVRAYVRDGRLKAVRIGKQYRVARADLEALTGGQVPMTPRESASRRRHVEVSSILQVDVIGRSESDRLTNLLMAATAGPHGLRVQTLYDEERASLKVIVIGGITDSAELLRLAARVLEED